MDSIKCDRCNQKFTSKASLRTHNNRFHKDLKGVKIHLPYEELSNAQIADRYLDDQKNILDQDKFNDLKRKIKGLEFFRPKPYERSEQISEDTPKDRILAIEPAPKPPRPSREADDEDAAFPSKKIRARVKTKKKMQCPICLKMFKNLTQHMKSHPRCPHCMKKFRNFKLLEEHVRIHAKPGALDRVDSHPIAVTNKEEEPMVVPMSDSDATVLDEEIHQPKIIRRKTNYDETNLDEEIHQPKILRRKENIPSITYTETCPICHKKIINLTQHKKIHPKCTRCKKRFLNFPILYQHVRDQHLSPPKTKDIHSGHVTCATCLKRFNNQTDFLIHDIKEHPQCPICHIKFKDIQSYADHRKDAHQTPIREIKDSDASTIVSNELIAPEDSDASTVLSEEIIAPDNRDSGSVDSQELISPDSDTSTVVHEDFPPLPSSDSDSSDSEDDLKIQDKKSRLHLNCVTVGMFSHVSKLIKANRFDIIALDGDLMRAVQIIIKGVLEGFIPICTSQRMALSPKMKRLMYRFSKNTSPKMVLENRENLTILFDILKSSIRTVVDSFNRFGI